MKLTDFKLAASSYLDDPNWNEDQSKQWGKDGSGCLIVCDKKILLLKRSQDVTEPGVWGIPGGARPLHEQTNKQKPAWASAVQETREELGGLPPGFGRYTKKFTYRGDGFRYDTFVVELPSGASKGYKPTLDWENDRWRWFGKGKVPKRLHFGLRWLLQRFDPFNL